VRDRTRPWRASVALDAIAKSAPFADYDFAFVTESGGLVSLVQDRVGGRHATSSGTSRPTYNASDPDFASKPSVTSDTSDDRLVTDAATISAWRFLHDGTGMEVMTVMRRGTSSMRPVWLTQHGSSNDQGTTLRCASNGAAQAYVGNASGGYLTAYSGSAIGASQTRVLGVTYQETATPKLAIYANGAVVASSSSWIGTPGPSSGNPTRQLGLLNYTSQFNEAFGGKVARVLVWNRVLTSAERAEIVALLNAMYGGS
jgi:hypothetical protein